MTGRSVTCDKMDRYPYLYVCGVGSGRKDELRHKNFHLPLKYEHGGVVEAVTYNGYRFRVENAAKVEVPRLEEGWQGKPLEHTGCRNFQFAVAAFGYPQLTAEALAAAFSYAAQVIKHDRTIDLPQPA